MCSIEKHHNNVYISIIEIMLAAILDFFVGISVLGSPDFKNVFTKYLAICLYTTLSE